MTGTNVTVKFLGNWPPPQGADRIDPGTRSYGTADTDRAQRAEAGLSLFLSKEDGVAVVNLYP